MDKELQKAILEKKGHDDIPAKVTELENIGALLKTAKLCGDARKAIKAATYNGRLAIGTHYALKKLQKLEQLAPDEQAKVAKQAIDKVTEKSVTVPKHMMTALKKLAAK